MEKKYTEEDIVSFGNYLLKDRLESNNLVTNKDVTHADLENWKELQKEKK